jgi:hypothetical protein
MIGRPAASADVHVAGRNAFDFRSIGVARADQSNETERDCPKHGDPSATVMPQPLLEGADLFVYIEIHCVRDTIGVEITEMC